MITLRPVCKGDEPFLLRLYASTRQDELALTGWSEAQKEAFIEMQFNAQQHYYGSENPAGDHRIILLNDRSIGRVYVSSKEEEVRILDITLLPEHRNRGTGTAIIRAILEAAAKEGKPVTIYVETFNPSLRLFERLGFSREKEEGIHYLLKWSPATEKS